MKKKVYIHIGTHKTGTTAIQLFSLKNTEILKKLNIHYAVESRPEANNLKYGHHLLPWFLMDRHDHYFGKYINKKDKVVTALINEIKSSENNNIILSSEVFSKLNSLQITKLKEYLSEFDVYIIAYFRRKDTLIETMYQTNVMNYNESRNIDECYDKMGIAINYYNFIKKWQNIFGEEKVKIKIYSKNALKDGDIVVDFYDLFGLDVKDLIEKTQNTNVNQTVPLQYTELIAILFKLNASKELIEDVKKLAKDSKNEDKINYHILSLDSRKKFSKSGYDEITKLKTKLSGRESLLISENELLNTNKIDKITIFENILNRVKYPLKEEAKNILNLIQGNKISKNKTKGKILVFGDSHSSYYEISKLFSNHIIVDNSLFGYKVVRTGFPGASVKGVGRRKSSLNITEKILEKIGSEDIVVLVLGQVDMELGIYYRKFVLEENDTPEIFIEECIHNYKILIEQVMKKAKAVIIKGINMPTNIDHSRAIEFTRRIITENLNEEKEIELAYNNLKKGMPHIVKRISMSQQFNNKLHEMCLGLGIEYFDINDEICYPNGMVKEEFLTHELDTHLISSLKVTQIHFKYLEMAIKNII